MPTVVREINQEYEGKLEEIKSGTTHDTLEMSGPQDGLADHVGIVEKVENGFVYIVEGNSGDSCRENRYAIGHYEIYGWGKNRNVPLKSGSFLSA